MRPERIQARPVGPRRMPRALGFPALFSLSGFGFRFGFASFLSRTLRKPGGVGGGHGSCTSFSPPLGTASRRQQERRSAPLCAEAAERSAGRRATFAGGGGEFETERRTPDGTLPPRGETGRDGKWPLTSAAAQVLSGDSGHLVCCERRGGGQKPGLGGSRGVPKRFSRGPRAGVHRLTWAVGPPRSASRWPCNPGHAAHPLCASVSTPFSIARSPGVAIR